MLTLAAAHVLNDTHDPFYTSLKAGAYDKVKPRGKPCNAAISDGCAGGRLGTSVTIGMAVPVAAVGAAILVLQAIWVRRSWRQKY